MTRSPTTTPQPGALRRLAVLARFPLGLAVSTARYAWWARDVRRTEQEGDTTDLPPALTPELLDEHVKTVDDGAGPLFHRLFRVRIRDVEVDAGRLVERLTADLDRVAPSEVVSFRKQRGRLGELAVGDEYRVRMPAPWDGPVRVVDRTPTSFRFVTLAGHLEAGQIEFAARWLGDGDGGDDEGGGEDDVLEFAITTWARAGDRLADLFYNHLGVAKEIQFQLWVNACVRAAAVSGGEAPAGVDVRTRVLPWAAAQRRGLVDASPGRGNPRG